MRFDPGEPWAIAETARRLLEITDAGADALRALPADVFFAPQNDRWSPAEHVRHLAKSSWPVALGLRLPAWVLRAMYGTAPRPSRRYAELRADYRAALAAGAQAGVFAPTRERPPGDPVARRERILSRWRAANAAVERALSRWTEEAADRARMKHPALGPLTVREMTAFTLYHNVHHLNLVGERLAGEASLAR